ncbi:MAG: hypothetical protein BJ554DRAFT_67 [Olpidium bornovanus]|uniref:Uncharacterized protein n=1 Tax=Olpidium bornovanus TaxID=278681 RepID=A0A8H7ZU34_9FUNG|nr:MAG: hypothetical protein BJ554DRAFT_67 [Olpidium bornovanus]
MTTVLRRFRNAAFPSLSPARPAPRLRSAPTAPALRLRRVAPAALPPPRRFAAPSPRHHRATVPPPRATPLPLSPHVTATRTAPSPTAIAPSNSSNFAVRLAASSPAPVDPAAVPIPPSPSLDARMDLPPLRVPLFITRTGRARRHSHRHAHHASRFVRPCRTREEPPIPGFCPSRRCSPLLAEWRASIVARVGAVTAAALLTDVDAARSAIVDDPSILLQELSVTCASLDERLFEMAASYREPRLHGCSTRGPIDDRSPVDRNRAYSVAFAPRLVSSSFFDEPPPPTIVLLDRKLVRIVVFRFGGGLLTVPDLPPSLWWCCQRFLSELELSGTFTEAQKLAELHNNVVPELCSFLNWDMERHRPLSTLQEVLDVLANLYASSYALNPKQIFASKVAQLRQEPAESMAAYLVKANALCIEYAAESNVRPDRHRRHQKAIDLWARDYLMPAFLRGLQKRFAHLCDDCLKQWGKFCKRILRRSVVVQRLRKN